MNDSFRQLWTWPIILAFVAMFPFLCFAIRGEPWFASDICGQIGTIEAMREGLAHGTAWPYDVTMGLGHDAIAYYGWYSELFMAMLAQILHLLGFAHASTIVALAAGTCVIGGIVLLSAAIGGVIGGVDANRSRGVLGGAIAGFVWILLPDDGHSAQGGGMISSLGLLANGIAMCAFLLCVLRLMVIQKRDRVYVDVGLSIAVCIVLGTHAITSVSAFLACVVALVMAPARARWSIFISGCLGALLAAPAIHIIIATMWQQTTLPRSDASGSDPISVACGAIGSVDQAVIAGIVVALSIGAALSWRRAPLIAYVSACLAIAALLPAAGVVLPGGLHRYRLLPMASIPFLVLGGPWLVDQVSHRTRHWHVSVRVLALCMLTVVVVFSGWRGFRPSMSGFDSRVLNEQTAALRPVLQSGSRVLVANMMAFNEVVPHRTYIHMATHELGSESVNSFHWLVSSVPQTPVSVAAASIGFPTWFVAVQPPMPEDVADRVLRDYGITHLIEPSDPDVLLPAQVEPIPGREAWLAGKSAAVAGVYRVWSMDNAAPRIEVIEQPVIRLAGVPAGGWIRHWWAEWWARTRARAQSSIRVVRWDDPTSADVQVPDSVMRATPRDGSVIDVIVNRFYESLNSLGKDLVSRSPASPASSPGSAPSCRWDGTTWSVEGLTPGRAYLLRYAYSSGFRWQGGTAAEELGGFTVLFPSGTSMHGSFDRLSMTWIWLSIVVSITTFVGLVTALIFYRFRRQN